MAGPTFDFRSELGGSWEKARGYLIDQFDRLFSGLAPIQSLFNLNATPPASSVLVTDASGAPSWSTTVPAALNLGGATALGFMPGASLPTVGGLIPDPNTPGIGLQAVIAIPPAYGVVQVGYLFGATTSTSGAFTVQYVTVNYGYAGPAAVASLTACRNAVQMENTALASAATAVTAEIGGQGAGGVTLAKGVEVSVQNGGANAYGVYVETFGTYTNKWSFYSIDTTAIFYQAGSVKLGSGQAALGGGAAATLGTVGGSGPSIAAQSGWQKFLDASGTPFYVPYWRS